MYYGPEVSEDFIEMYLHVVEQSFWKQFQHFLKHLNNYTAIIYIYLVTLGFIQKGLCVVLYNIIDGRSQSTWAESAMIYGQSQP